MTRHSSALSLVALAGAGLLLAGCASPAPADDSAPAADTATDAPTARVALTYDGGLYVLDAETLETLADIPLDGFNRLSSAGDGRHVMVTGEGGFRALDTGAWTDADGTSHAADPALTDVTFPASTPGHVVPHGGTTVLFDDGTGDMTIYPTDALLEAQELPESETVESEAAHHGVAILLEDDTLLATIGDSESRSGVRALDASRTETARAENCPGVHGEGTAANEVAVFGCEDGVLIYADGAFTKADSPDAFGRIGNQFTTDESTIALGDYKSDPDLEGYLLDQISFVDTEAATIDVVDLPEGASYTFRDLARGPHGEALVLSSDGSLYVFDAETREQTAAYPVIDAWDGPAEWQDAHPAIKVIGHTAYITEPASNSIHAVDVESGEILATGTLEATPNEIAVVTG
ncbi:MAG: zinc metallochaperone AztD [Microbacteriaceae bacterium]